MTGQGVKSTRKNVEVAQPYSLSKSCVILLLQGPLDRDCGALGCDKVQLTPTFSDDAESEFLSFSPVTSCTVQVR